MNWLYKNIQPAYNPLTYRLKRQTFIYNSIVTNCLDLFILWIGSLALIVVFMMIRVICMPFHYWGDHFATLDRSYRYQVFIRGF